MTKGIIKGKRRSKTHRRKRRVTPLRKYPKAVDYKTARKRMRHRGFRDEDDRISVHSLSGAAHSPAINKMVEEVGPGPNLSRMLSEENARRAGGYRQSTNWDMRLYKPTNLIYTPEDSGRDITNTIEYDFI